MRRWGLALIPVAALALAACSSGPTMGTVIAKQYTPGHEYTYQQPISHETCKPVYNVATHSETDQCSTTFTYVPVQRYDPPDWQLQLQNGSAKGWVDVSHATYYGKGDYYGKVKG